MPIRKRGDSWQVDVRTAEGTGTIRLADAVRGEWNLVCLTHNPLKLFRSGYALKMA